MIARISRATARVRRSVKHQSKKIICAFKILQSHSIKLFQKSPMKKIDQLTLV